MLTSLGNLYQHGVSIDWSSFHRYTDAKKVTLPGYHFDETRFWINIKDDGSLPFHPLLGGFLLNPSEVTMFKNQMNIRYIPFLKDHTIGDKIIFPCAGYLDMCSTAGLTTSNPNVKDLLRSNPAITVKNFAIHVPVCLTETNPTEFQVSETTF